MFEYYIKYYVDGYPHADYVYAKTTGEADQKLLAKEPKAIISSTAQRGKVAC